MLLKANFWSITLIGLLMLLNCTVFAQSRTVHEKEIDELISKMTLEEKIGQMTLYSSFWDFTGPAPQEGDSKLKFEQINSGLVGGMLNASGVDQVRSLQKMAVENSRLGIPMIFGLDVIHGHRTVMPIPLAEAASWDMEAIEASSRLSAVEASAVGINWTFAPMVDVSRDARWGRVMEGAGEDPFLASKVAVARVRGYQGDDLSANNTLAACTKHLAGYGFSEAGREYNTVDIGTVTLHNMVLPPFKATAEAGVSTMMNAFNTLNGVPATGNELLQRDILKDGWGFKGFIVSDWASAAQMRQHGTASDLKHAAEIAVNAGSDMDMESYAYPRHLQALVEEGIVDISKVDDAVRRILRVKFDLGLFEDPYKYCDEQREKTLLYTADHLTQALDMAKKSIVLLKNEDDVLPLNKEQKGILVVGALASEKNSPLGSWRFGSVDSSAVSVVEGIESMGVEFDFAQGPEIVLGQVSFREDLKINNFDRKGFREAVQQAKEAEVVIMVLGEHGFMSGEARSRTDIGLPGLQQELLEAVHAVNKNIILVVMNGRPLALPWAAKNVKAIVEAWQLGSQSGNAIASVLFGEFNPSGKLPMSFPRNVGQVPIYYNQLNTGRPRTVGDVFWSHYSDVENSPLYPFGYGLSYTSFEYDNLNIEIKEKNRVFVTIDLKNTGKMAGQEVVQLYIRDNVCSVSRPIKELKGFEKISLAPGEIKTVQFELTEKELGYYDGNGQFFFEQGDFEIMVGPNSRDLKKQSITLE